MGLLLRKLPVVLPVRLGPREGLELELMKLGCTGPPLEPRRRPQAGKSGDPRSLNADTRLQWVVGAKRCVFLSYTHARACEALGSK